MTGEYDHLRREILGRFRFREERGGQKHGDLILNDLAYCELDLLEVGGDGRGFPNRVAVAAFTREPAYLTHYGNREVPESVLAAMRERGIGAALRDL